MVDQLEIPLAGFVSATNVQVFQAGSRRRQELVRPTIESVQCRERRLKALTVVTAQ